MLDITPLINLIDRLNARSTRIYEETYRVTFEGQDFDAELSGLILEIRQEVVRLEAPAPIFLLDEQTVAEEELREPQDIVGSNWRFVIGKTSIASQLAARDNESTFLFFSVRGLCDWLKQVDPFIEGSAHDPNFSGSITIRVVGLQYAFGGPSVWVLPHSDVPPGEIPLTALPESEAVHGLIHINAERKVWVRPKNWALTWGELQQESAILFAKLSAMVLSACLVQELRLTEDKIIGTIRGTKLISVPLLPEDQNIPLIATLPVLIDAVEWVYEERSETRLKLVTDRLSIDIDGEQTLLSGIQHHIEEALKQARDSYAFVILERKDAYLKEMRELMKDMKSQADLYAAKVRDLIASLTRDILGVLIFLSFSLLGKFDHQTIKNLLDSAELSVLMRFVAGYLVVSAALQIIANLKDAELSFNESQKWLNVLQNYTSRTENEDRFLAPIKKRRTTLFIAMVIIGIIYFVIAFLIWNLPFVAKLLLSQP